MNRATIMTRDTSATENENPLDLELSPLERSHRLRAKYWERAHLDAVTRKPLLSCGEDNLLGHARDLTTLLEASEPAIQAEELIVGIYLALPHERKALNLGYYNPHYPPGYATLLRLGLTGIRDEARRRLESETDPARSEFLRAVALSYDAACHYVARYATLARRLAKAESSVARGAELRRIAAICDELSTSAPSSFYAALQLVQFVRVLGGSGCLGRFDQWLYPFYARDLASGALTRDAAQELLECLFIKMNEFGTESELAALYAVEGQPFAATSNDSLRNIALAGQTPQGQDACNPLTFMCLQASARLMLPEPKLNVRFFGGTPRRLLHECCRVLAKGANILAVFNDDVVLPALDRLGIPIEDARDYCNDGCSEIIIGGKGTIRFSVYDSLAVLTDTVLEAGLAPYATFEELLNAFKARLTPFMPEGHGQDEAITHPFFAASIEDCLTEASATGARYSLYGSILAQVGNTADGLAAIKKLVYEDGTIGWDDLVSALRANYEGYEPLRQMLLHRAPKYGNDDDAVDNIAREITEYFCNGVHLHADNPQGYGPKRAAGLMCFGIHRKRDLPASPDGRRKGDLTANSFSPAVGMDHSGPTAVLKSVAKIDLTHASHGSVLDIALHSSVFRGDEGAGKLASLVEAFLALPCTATLQLNVIDRETLLRARADPTNPEFRTLIVRVWGFSAVFVDLPAELQDHVLARTEHA